MHYGEIKKFDIADGPGVRVTLFVSGCTNHCKGCFQPQTWDFAYGEPFDGAAQQRVLDLLAPDYVSGLTLLGGEPFEPSNQECLVPFLRKWRMAYPAKNVWCYTGCVLESDLLKPTRWRTPFTDEMLSMIDVLVDGPFVESLKDISLRFRGSSNQRILDIRNGAEHPQPWGG